MMQPQVFLGGTAGKNRWREQCLIPALTARGIAPDILFNPVVAEWDEAAQQREDEVKAKARYILFYLGDPRTGEGSISVYSLVEAIMSLYDDPQRAVVVFDLSEVERHARKVMQKTLRDLRSRFPDAPIFEALEPAIDWLAARLAPSSAD